MLRAGQTLGEQLEGGEGRRAGGCGPEAGMGLTTAAARRRAEGDVLKYFVEDPGTGTLYKRGQLLGQVTRPGPGGVEGRRAAAALPRAAPETGQAVLSGRREALRILSKFRPATAAGKGQLQVVSFKPEATSEPRSQAGAAAGQTCPETGWSLSAPPFGPPFLSAPGARSAKACLLSPLQPPGAGGGLLASRSLLSKSVFPP